MHHFNDVCVFFFFYLGNNRAAYKVRIIVKSFVVANIKKVTLGLIFINKNIIFLFFSLRKVASTFTIERVVNILY